MNSKTTTSGHAQLSPEETSTLVAIAGLKSAVRDPESLAIDDVTVTDSSICLTYRARNGFGGVNRERAVFGRDLKTAFNQNAAGFVRAWNRGCAKQSGRDLTRFAQYNLSRLK